MQKSRSGSDGRSYSTAGTGMGSFLEELQSRGVGVGEFHPEDVESMVLSALADGSSKDVAAIMSDSSGVPLGQLLLTLEKLERFGLVARGSSENLQKFSISEAGKRAVQLMREPK